MQIQEASWEIHRWSMMLHEGTLTAEAILDKAAQATQLLSALSDLVPALKVVPPFHNLIAFFFPSAFFHLQLLKEPILRELAARVHPSLLHSEPPTPVFTSPPASPTGQPHLHPQPQPRQPLIATRPSNLKDLNFLLPTTCVIFSNSLLNVISMPPPESRNANSLHSSLPSPVGFHFFSILILAEK